MASLQLKRKFLIALCELMIVGMGAIFFPQLLARAGIRRWGSWLQIDAPNSNQVRAINLWATYYYVHSARSVSNGQPLLDPEGNRLGPILSVRDWCYAALQGTVLVADRPRPITYNFAGRGSISQQDCSPFFSSLSGETLDKVSRARFGMANAPFGYGTGGFNLVPYRTIAVDRSQIPLGSVLFIPAARGLRITLPTGEQVIHDGYFFAADVGSAIHGNHVDVFVGVSDLNPFPFVTSTSNRSFQAYVVQNPEITQALWILHQGK